MNPTVGRVVLYRPQAGDPGFNQHLPESVRFAATVAGVQVSQEGEPDIVNLSVVTLEGRQFARVGVPLVGIEDKPEPGECEWMPYQKGQAAKNDSLTDDILRRIEELELAIAQRPLPAIGGEDVPPPFVTGTTGPGVDAPQSVSGEASDQPR